MGIIIIHASFKIRDSENPMYTNILFSLVGVGYFRTTSIMEKEEVNKDRPDSECLWVLGKKYKERRFTESDKYLIIDLWYYISV